MIKQRIVTYCWLMLILIPDSASAAGAAKVSVYEPPARAYWRDRNGEMHRLRGRDGVILGRGGRPAEIIAVCESGKQDRYTRSWYYKMAASNRWVHGYDIELDEPIDSDNGLSIRCDEWDAGVDASRFLRGPRSGRR
jgi:hypothetical protein